MTSDPSNHTSRQKRTEPLDSAKLSEDAEVLVTLRPDSEVAFLQQASQSSLEAVWDNKEDDVYAQLLQ